MLTVARMNIRNVSPARTKRIGMYEKHRMSDDLTFKLIALLLNPSNLRRQASIRRSIYKWISELNQSIISDDPEKLQVF